MSANFIFGRRNNKKEKSVAELAQSVCHFINTVRALRVSSVSADDESSSKWGKRKPRLIYNVDQVPLPFASDSPITLEFEGTKNVWVRQLGSGLDKRQCTLQLCIRWSSAYSYTGISQQECACEGFRQKEQSD